MTSPDNNQVVAALDENTRRYYLDAMGIQCWQLLEPENTSSQTPFVAEQDVSGQSEKSKLPEILARGNETAEIMFVLLAPNENDMVVGELCSGEEGALLTKMLAAINVSITDVYITSLIQKPSTGDVAVSENELIRCNVILKQQVKKVKPKILVALGEMTAQFLLEQKIALDALREDNNLIDNKSNQFKSTYESIPLFVSYSPAELLQKTENKRKAWLDLQQLEKLLQT